MSSRRPQVLLVSPYSLHPMIHGGAVRIRNLLRRAAHACDIDVLIFLGGSDDPEQREALAPECRRVFFQQIPDQPSGDPRLPPDAASFTDPLIAERIRALVLAHGYDLVQLEYAELGAYASASFCGIDLGVPVILTEHDLSFRSHERRRKTGIADDSDDELRRDFELAACRAAARIHVMSENDRAVLTEAAPEVEKRTIVVANGVDVEHYRPPATPAARDLLFAGSFPHLPNLDAVRWFLGEAWLDLRAQRPDLRLTLAGARPPEEITALDGEHGVNVAGEVESLRPLYQEHRLMIVPLRAGSGTRLKILEAMACGLPVVSTTIGAEGLGAEHEEHLLIADDPRSIVEACLRIVGDDELHERLAHGGRRLVEERFSWDAIVRRMIADYELVIRETGVPAKPRTSSVRVVEPLISVLVRDEPSDGCCDFLDRQQIGVNWELVCGRTLNEAANLARGRVLVTLARDAEGDDARWLDKIVAPFAESAPPAAVAGTVHEIYEGHALRHRTAATSLHEHLHMPQEEPDFSSADFSLANAAVRRDVWEAFPFDEEVRLSWTWLRRARANRLFVLPILAAWIVRRRRFDAATLWREAQDEGRALQDFGAEFALSALWDDLRRPSRAVDGSLRAFVRGGRGLLRFHPWLWTLGVHLGARKGRR